MPLQSLSNVAKSLSEKTSRLTNQIPTALLSETNKQTWLMRAFAITKVPLLAFLNPKIIESDDETVIVKIPLGYRSKNHLNSMYFGALSAGADLAVGLLAMHHIEKNKKETNRKVQLVFKTFNANFLKRAESDVFFSCKMGSEIAELVKKANDSEERVELPIKATAYTPKLFGDEPVAQFELLLSLKAKN